MTIVYPSLCRACVHFQAITKSLGPTCTSFMQGIPERVFFYGGDHRESFAGEEPFALDPNKREEYDAWKALQRSRDRAAAREMAA